MKQISTLQAFLIVVLCFSGCVFDTLLPAQRSYAKRQKGAEAYNDRPRTVLLEELLYEQLDPLPRELIKMIVAYESRVTHFRGRFCKELVRTDLGLAHVCVVGLEKGIDGKLLAVYSDNKILVWDYVQCDAGTVVQTFQVPQAVRRVLGPWNTLMVLVLGKSHDIATVTTDGTVQEKAFVGHMAPVSCLALVSLSEQLFASAGEDGLIIIWNVATQKSFLAFDAQQQGVASMVSLGDRKIVTAPVVTQQLKLWNFGQGQYDTLQLPQKKKHRIESYTICLAAGPEEHLFLVASSDRTITIWDSVRGKIITSVPTKSQVAMAASLSDTELIFTYFHSDAVYIFNRVDKTTEVSTLATAGNVIRRCVPLDGGMLAVVIEGKGKQHTPQDSVIQLWA